MDLNFLDKNCVEILKRMAPTLEDSFGLCIFGSVKKDCRLLFSETVTEEGICFTFNIFNSDQMMNDIRYKYYGPYIENYLVSF